MAQRKAAGIEAAELGLVVAEFREQCVQQVSVAVESVGACRSCSAK